MFQVMDRDTHVIYTVYAVVADRDAFLIVKNGQFK